MILEEFATPFHGLPRKCWAPSSDAGDLEPKTVQAALRDKVSILVSDAAANELIWKPGLAWLAPSSPMSGSSAGMLRTRPRVCLLRRPLCHHDVLKSLLAEFVTQSDSFAHKVFHFDVFSSWWRAALTRDDDGDEHSEYRSGTGMSAAKHRFGSYALPLGRICRNVVAMAAVCHRVDAMRALCASWPTETLRLRLGGLPDS